MKVNKKLIESGVNIAGEKMYYEDRIWSRYSNDKVDIGEELTKVIRTLDKAVPLTKKMSALSIGSSAEPQFRILETAFRKGLYLLDVDKNALNIINERIKRQSTDHVKTLLGDYNKYLLKPGKIKLFSENKLEGNRMDLITLHHSLYYCSETVWGDIFVNLFKYILTPKGAIHAVLMSSETNNENTTTWLYNHFVEKYFGLKNTQDLLGLKRKLKKNRVFKDAQILSKTNRVNFYVDDFEKFMAVIWMILLYPDVHHYSIKQRTEITEFVYKKFWIKKKPLIQAQDHLVIYRDIEFKGLI